MIFLINVLLSILKNILFIYLNFIFFKLMLFYFVNSFLLSVNSCREFCKLIEPNLFYFFINNTIEYFLT